MKPYCKTLRFSKIHKSKKCRLCAETTSGGKNYMRQQFKKEIKDLSYHDQTGKS